MAVFRRLLLAQIQTIVIFSITIFIIMLLISYFVGGLPPGEVSIMFWEVTFFLSLYIAKMQFIQGRYFSVLKNQAKNLRSLWLNVIIQNILLFCIAGLSFLLFSKFAPFKISDQMSVWLFASILLTTFLLMCYSDSFQIMDRIQSGAPQRTQVLRLLALMVTIFLLLAGLLLVYVQTSPLLACLLLNVVLLYILIYRSHEAKKTIPAPAKFKIFISLVALIIIYEGLLGYGDYRFSNVADFYIRPEKTWSFSESKNIKSIEDWVYWQNKLKSLDPMSADEIIASYEILNKYCPPVPRDNPLRVECNGSAELRDYQYTGKKPKSEEDVLRLLSAPSEYSQIIGIIYSRKLKKPMSRDLIVAIEYIADKESTIQGLARNTLTQSYPTDYQDGILIDVTPTK